MNKVLFILLGLFLLSGCSRDLRRKKRALRKIEQAKILDPSLFRKDTIIFHDTILVKQYNTDTITKIVSHDTTTVVNNDRLVLKYFYDTLRQEIYHEAECKGDTVIKERIQVVEKYRGLSVYEKIQMNIIPFILGLVLLIFLIRKRNYT